MSDNVELVRRSFEAMRAWDVDALLGLYDPGVEYLPLTGTLVESGGYRGHEGVRAYFAEARDLWDLMEPEGQDYRDLGDRVVVAGRCRVRGRVSGAESHPTCAWVIHVREGAIVSHRTCATYEEALQIAGLDPSGDQRGEADVETLKRGYAALNRGDLSVVLELLDPDIEWHEPAPSPEAGTHRGRDSFERFLRGWLESFDGFRVEPEQVVERGDELVAVVRQSGTGRSSGVHVDTRLAHVWTIASGKAVRWESIADPEAALSDGR